MAEGASVNLGNISTKSLPMVIMQHASFLYRQRTLRGLRSTIKTTTASTTSWCKILSTKNIRNTAVPHTLLPSRSKKSCSRSLHANMSSLLKARNVGHRSVWLGSSDRGEGEGVTRRDEKQHLGLIKFCIILKNVKERYLEHKFATVDKNL
ncbi:CLUMA_CG013856, isoform A [Clunio marinus]|uniref:CLUMA_CG013856, isoform A n=1 Tax=Clunio marinus TaxID=568069 RepID=A0A1J1IM06_9DIPT|nr:CLUMA_CG013856, isoform A [Clunio marinus]